MSHPFESVFLSTDFMDILIARSEAGPGVMPLNPALANLDGLPEFVPPDKAPKKGEPLFCAHCTKRVPGFGRADHAGVMVNKRVETRICTLVFHRACWALRTTARN